GYGGSCSVTTRADTPAFSSAIFAIDDSPVEIKIFRHSFLAFRENYGTLGLAFIKQYESKKDVYKNAFESYQRYFNQKGSNE
ncbi:hypothetical protein INP07_14285, partial [Staphylococcus aureus]|nr:hypothetical protein [Staphylococcus aureus]MBO8497843.1 hypothetical protein [Staphylococcus aureus]